MYTIPDITWNRSPSVILNIRHALTSSFTLSGNAYFRYIRADTTNGDINNDSFDQALYTLSAADIRALNAAGYRGFPTTGSYITQPFPYWRCIAQGLQKSEPSEVCTGLLTNTYDKQNNWGLSAQASWLLSRNHFTAGGAWDRSSISFTSVAVRLPESGCADDYSHQCFRGRQHDPRWSACRYARKPARAHEYIQLVRERYSQPGQVDGCYDFGPIQPDGSERPGPTSIDLRGARGSLNGRYVFERFNPAAGFTYSPFHFATAYFSYSESAALRPQSNWAAPTQTNPAICPMRS